MTIGRVTEPADDVLDEIEHRGLGPVDVLEADERAAVAGESLEHASDRPEDLLARGRLRGSGQPSQQLEDACRAGRRPISASRREARRGPPRLDERPVRDPLAVREAPPDETTALAVDPREQLRASRDLPTPAGPRDVTSRQRPSLDRPLECPPEQLQLASRPTSGASRRRATAGASVDVVDACVPTSPCLPFTENRSRGPTVTASLTSGYVAVPIRIRPAPPPARAAWRGLTASPVTNVSPVDGSPATTSPVLIPIRQASSTPQRARSSSLRRAEAALHLPARPGRRGGRRPRARRARRRPPSPRRRRTARPCRRAAARPRPSSPRSGPSPGGSSPGRSPRRAPSSRRRRRRGS